MIKSWIYSSHGIAFDGAVSWNFCKDFARNVVILGVENMLSTHADNISCLVLREGLTYCITGSFGSPDKTFSIKFSKARTKFCFSLDYGDNSYLFVNEEKIFKFKADNKNVTFPTQFCLGSICNGFDATESREVPLKENMYDFSVYYNAIDKSDILNIHKYLMVKINIK